MTAQQYLLTHVSDRNRVGVYALLWILSQNISPDLPAPDAYADNDPCVAILTWDKNRRHFAIEFNAENDPNNSLSWFFIEHDESDRCVCSETSDEQKRDFWDGISHYLQRFKEKKNE